MSGMILTAHSFADRTETRDSSFWKRILNEQELERCPALEKLLVGCEIIAALDAVDLLAA